MPFPYVMWEIKVEEYSDAIIDADTLCVNGNLVLMPFICSEFFYFTAFAI